MKFFSRNIVLILALILLPLALGAFALRDITSPSPEQSFHPDIDAEVIRLASLSEKEIPAFIENLDRSDLVAAYYRDPSTRPDVVQFFTGLTYSEKVARSILENADRLGVPPALAFALAYEESRFKVAAIHDNGDSVDRGLFQLNSKAFPELGPAQVYDPTVNARYGLSHLEYFLRVGGNEVAALAMYNAGMHRVTKSGTPRKTLDYIFRILSYEQNIESLFGARVVVRERGRIGRAEGEQSSD